MVWNLREWRVATWFERVVERLFVPDWYAEVGDAS